MPILRLDGDSTGAVRATEAVAKGGKKIADAFDGAGKSAKALERDLTKIVQSNEGPQERYNRKMRELGDIMFRTNMTLAQYTAQANRLKRELDGVGVSAQKAFSPMVGYLSTIAGPAALMALATSALRSYGSELDTLAGKMQGGIGDMGQLAQLAVGDKDPQAKMKALVAESTRYYGMGATKDLPTAMGLTFQMESASIMDPGQRARLAEYMSYGVIPDAKDFSSGIAALRMSYPNLTPGQLLGMGMVAAVPSPGQASQIVQQSARAAMQLESVGWGPGFGLAATSLLSRQTGSPEMGQERLAQYAKQLQFHGMVYDPALKGMDPLAVLERVGERTRGGTDPAMLQEYVGGRMEAIEGFRGLYKNRKELAGLTKLAESGDETLVQRALELAKGTPQIDAARQAVASRNQLAISRFGQMNTRELYGAMLEEKAARKGGGLGASSELGVGKFLDPGMYNEWAANRVMRSQLKRDSGMDPDLSAAISRHLESIDDKTKTKIPSGRQTQP